MNTIYEKSEVLGFLKAYVSDYPSQRKAAQSLDISETYLSDVLNNRREISESLANKLGFTKTGVFQSID